MLLPLIAALQAFTPADPVQQGGQEVFHGIQGEIEARAPRIENAGVVLDGRLDEATWGQAALLTGFSQYMPVDGRPAEDTTQVLVWYSPTAIYFGIRAFESHGTVNASLAQRDHIESDDYIQIMLDTFYDRRRILVFGVNPLGVQSDGVRAEGQVSAPGASPGTVDLNPDFVYESKGHVTAYGYEVEVRIPFKSVRYGSGATQSWGLNIDRKVQHSGYENTWTRVRRASSSFISQEGTLAGLTDLKRGLVLELNPFTTGKADGSRVTPGGPWHYDASPDAGLNLRWGVTSNLTMDGTFNPDFSQVEGDVSQIAADPRFALFYPEKRPFFLEGLDQFSNPNRLIYTRQMVSPRGGLKLTGKVSGTNVAVISVVDDPSASATGSHPVYNLTRLRRDIGRQSSLGLAYTDKVDGGNYNRVAALDSRILFGGMYYAEFQAGASATRTGAVSKTPAPLYTATVDRTGRKWGFHYTFLGLHPDFQAQSGFVSRVGIAQVGAANRFTWYGARGSTFEAFTTRVELTNLWLYGGFWSANAPLETKLGTTATLTLRGGWILEAKPGLETYAFDPAPYASYRVRRVTGGATDTVAFALPGRVSGVFGSSLRVATPRFKSFSGEVTIFPKRDVEFREGAIAPSLSISASLDWRPSDKIRISPLVSHLHHDRARDGTRIDNQSVARLKTEYQLSRAILLRFVGQYTAQDRDALRDPRTDEPILLYSAARGTAVATTRQRSNALRVDWLFSYQPNPGTVFFAGYGAGLSEPDAFRFNALSRTSDSFFLKLSYLFHS